jgi:eukaryotic-like serine/threonine-protein kinase
MEGGEQTVMYRGNLQNTGVYDTRAPRTFRDEPNWVFHSNSPITSPLVVGDGTLFFVTRGGAVHAVDAATGAEKWVFNSDEDVINAPAVGNGIVVLTDCAYRVVALDIHRGQPVPINLERNDDFFSPPRIVENLMIVGGTDSIYAFEIPELQLRWSLASVAGGFSFSCPAVADGIAYFAFDRGAIAGLDLRTGSIVSYELEVGLYTVHDPVVHNGVIYVFASESEDPGLDAAPPSRTLLTLDTAGIGEMNKHEVAPMFVMNSPAVCEGTVYFGCADSSLYAIDRVTWQLKWRFQTGGRVASSPSIVAGFGHVLEGLAYFGSDDGNLYVLNKDTGDLVRRLATTSGKPVRTDPVLWDGAVYFADTGGTLYSWGSAAIH